MNRISSLITNPFEIFNIPFVIMQKSMDFAVVCMNFAMDIARTSV